jgi:hypothetical protein
VQLSIPDLEDYLSRLAEHLERYGVVLDLEDTAPLGLDESPTGVMSFQIRGFLPDGRMPQLSIIEVRERWRRLAQDRVERSEYEFELIDHERGYRRAFHLHDGEYFVRRYQVVAHGHCEEPIGTSPCAHFADSPVRDGYRGVDRLMETWIDPSPPDCSKVDCLE